jgi:serine/threonine-protein kinase RsbW
MLKPEISGNTITVPSSLEYLEAVDDFVEGLLVDWGVEKSDVTDIAIAVSELVNNAVSHGNRGASEQPVEVTVTRRGATVVVRVTDSGGGFDIDSLESPVEDDNLLRQVGRGIFIVRSLMDRVEVEPTATGTAVTIHKRVS